MRSWDVLARAREFAEEADIAYVDLVGLAPERQIAAIRDRLSRKAILVREELFQVKLELQRLEQARKRAERAAA